MSWFAEVVGGMIIGALIECVERVCAGLWRLPVRAGRWLGRLVRSGV